MAHKHKKKPVQQLLSPNKLIKERGRSYPIHKCLINRGWNLEGLATIMIVRKMGGDKFLLGSYMVDIFCLGVKGAFSRVVDQEELDYFLKESAWINSDCDITLAQNIIYGAMEYAEDLGFKPHPDFNLAKYVIDDVEDVEYMDVEFGKNGKPFYIQGPDDSKYLHVLATLDKNVGAGNYEHIIAGDDMFDDDEDEIDFDTEAEGLEEQDYLNYMFAFKTATAMDDLEEVQDNDYESIDEVIRAKCIQDVRNEIVENLLADENLTEKEREETIQFEAENPMINIIQDIAESLLDGIVEFEETFAHLPSSFKSVATYFYATRVKEGYFEEVEEVKDDIEDDYVDFEEVK